MDEPQKIEENSPSRAGKPIFELIADPKATQTLPSLKIIVDELAQMMSQTHTPIQAISSLVRRDQSMAVRILRLANSAYFAPAQPILNIEEALLYLGFNQIRSSILTARCIEQMVTISTDLLSWKAFWNHSVAVGCISRILATKLTSPIHNTETYYVMGLLHDIGKLTLAYLAPEDFEHVLTQAQKNKKEMSSIEFETMGADHAGLGAWYLQQQGLPASIFEPVRLHHSWNMAEGDKNIHACVVGLANRFAHALNLGQSGSFYPAKDPYQSAEWNFYLEKCSVRDNDELIDYVATETESLYLLVDQLAG